MFDCVQARLILQIVGILILVEGIEWICTSIGYIAYHAIESWGVGSAAFPTWPILICLTVFLLMISIGLLMFGLRLLLGRSALFGPLIRRLTS